MTGDPILRSTSAEAAAAVLAAVVENIGMGIALVAPDGVPFQVNPALSRMLGYTQDELLGMPFTQYTHPDDVAADAALYGQLCAGGRDHYRLDKRCLRKDATVVWVSLTVSAVRGTGGELWFAVALVEDVTERRGQAEDLRWRALHDDLTGLPNRAVLTDRLQHLGRSRRAGEVGEVALFFLDLDDFKTVNDTLGHAVGDQVLREVAVRLRSATRAGDLVVRLGGDEFVVIGNRVSGDLEAVAYAERLLAALTPVVLIDGQPIVTRASIGVAMSSPGSHDLEVLLRNSDIAMLRAKAEGSGQLAVHADPAGARRPGGDAPPSLRAAIESGAVQPWYQPIVHLGSGRVVSAEALARWVRDDGTAVAPASFIALAERTGLIGPLDRLVMHTAADALTTGPLRELGGCAVNASPLQISSGLIVDEVRDVLAASGLPPQRLTVELTETAVLGDPVAARRHLEELKAMGVRIALDDFGTGYSSLSHLEELPIDVVKLDRSFVGRIGEGRRASRISSAVVGLARDLGMSVVAEGVETEQQQAALTGMGCVLVQGFLYGAAVPAAEFAARHLPSPQLPAPVVSSRPS